MVWDHVGRYRDQDYRDDPVYKKNIQELTERQQTV
jgi:hypothetical protein